MGQTSQKSRCRLAGLGRLTALALIAACALASPAAAKAPRSFFGAVPQTTLSQTDFERMGEAGVATLRLPLYWYIAQPSDTVTDFAQFDSLVRPAAKNGITVLPFLYGTPGWVAEGIDHRNCAADCLLYPPKNQSARAAWKAFARKAAARYGPNGAFWSENPGVPKRPIRSWQIWNEQNSKTFYKPKPDPGEYAKLLADAASGIHGADRKADIILGGMFGVPGGNGDSRSVAAATYLRNLYKVKGVKSDFNGIALHPYSRLLKSVEKQVLLSRKELQRARDSKTDLWITEIGWASGGSDNPLNLGSTKAQAKQLTAAYKMFLANRKRWHVRSVEWFAWRDAHDADDVCFFCSEAGLLSESGQAKPALGAYRRVAHKR
jgi:hypothetical protein